MKKMRNKQEQHKEITPKKLKVKFSLIFVISVVIIFSVIYYNSVQQIQRAASIISSTAGIPVLSRAATFVDGDKYESLARTLDETDPFFIETQAKFRELRQEINCLYLYTMARTDDDVHFYIFDGENPASEGFSPIGSVEENFANLGKEYLLAYETKDTHFTPMMQESGWGRLISAYMPILNSNGDVVGVIGVDFDGNEVYQAIMETLRNQIILALVFAITVLILTLYFFRDIERIYMRINTAIHDLSCIDSLTEIRNRRYLDEAFPDIISNLMRVENGKLSVLMIDVDFFKLYNDTYGHGQGDECLRRIAQALARELYRATDITARFGGEEFVVILPYTGKAGAVIVAEKLLQCVRELEITHEKSPIAACVTISVGVVSIDSLHSHDWHDYIERADEALYISKEKGRNTYTCLDLNTADKE